MLIKDQDQIHYNVNVGDGVMPEDWEGKNYGKIMCQFCGGKDDPKRTPADLEIWVDRTTNLHLCKEHAIVIARLLLVDVQDLGPYCRHLSEKLESPIS